ncbi:MAG: hypothetical protein WCA16_20325 [Candidatus Sulfotelmatobacter sp.]
MPVVVHVLCDPAAPFAKSLGEAGLRFALTRPHLSSGKGVMVATNADGRSFLMLLKQLGHKHGEDLVIVTSPSELPDDSTVRTHIGGQHLVCGTALAYIPDWVAGESLEATNLYLQYLAARCQDGA